MMYSKILLPDVEQWIHSHPEAGSSWPSWPRDAQGMSPMHEFRGTSLIRNSPPP